MPPTITKDGSRILCKGSMTLQWEPTYDFNKIYKKTYKIDKKGTPSRFANAQEPNLFMLSCFGPLRFAPSPRPGGKCCQKMGQIYPSVKVFKRMC